MKKSAQVVMLPTNEKAIIGFLTQKGKERCHLVHFDTPMPNILDSENQHLYFLSDEEIKEGDWVIAIEGIWKNTITKITGTPITDVWRKIILTTDQDLIKDGVQAIDDEFLEWFVKNPSCEDVEIELFPKFSNNLYGIIIPKEEPKQELPQLGTKEFNDLASAYFGGKLNHLASAYFGGEPKQETLEEAADRLAKKYGYDIEGGKVADFVDGVVRGAEWQAERTPSIIEEYLETAFISKEQGYMNPQKWFEQFKKK